MSCSWSPPSPVRTLVVALVATALALTAAAPSGAAPDTSHRAHASGYAVPDHPGWIGSFRLGATPVYRLNGTRGVTGRYLLARRLATRSTRHVRAAYLLSRYGSTVTRTRAAALDAAVLHLLSTPAHRLDGTTGRARVRHVGRDAGTVRHLARRMLAESGVLAGPYATTLTTSAPTTTVGHDVTLAFRVAAASGRPVVGSPVAFTYAGTTTRTVTDAHGRATATVRATAGSHPVRATALRLHDWQPTIRHSDVGGSGVGVGGVTRTVTRTATVTAVHRQTVTIGPMAPAVRPVGAPFGTPQLTVAGGSGARTATFTMHAGESAAAVRGCPGAAVGAWPARRAITTDSYEGPMPGYVAPRTRFYAWKVTVSGNGTSTAATACSTPVKVVTTATLAQARTGGYRVAAGSTTGVDVAVDGFDRVEAHQVSTSLYGPFDTAAAAEGRCVAAKRVRGPLSATISGDTTFRPRIATPNAVGRYFVWGTTLTGSAAQFVRAPAPACGRIIRVVR